MQRLPAITCCLVIVLSALPMQAESPQRTTQDGTDATDTRPAQDPLRYGEPLPAGIVGSIGEATLTWPEFVAAVCDKYQASSVGTDAVNDLVRRRIIDHNMKSRGITVTDEEMQAEYKRLDQQFREATKGKSDLKTQIAESGRSEADFYRLLHLQIALQKLVAIDMKDATGSTPAVVQGQWLTAKTREAEVEMSPAKLPAEATARVYGDHVSREEFVRHVLTKVEEKDVGDLANILLQARLAAALCAARRIEVKPEDVEREFERARQAFTQNPKYEGLHFEDMLRQETGMAPDKYRSSAAFNLVVTTYLLGVSLVPDDDAAKAFTEDADWYGPIYEVRHIFLRGSDDPRLAGKVRTKAQSKTEAEKAMQRLNDGAIFEELVKEISEDPNSKFKEGFLARSVPRQWDTDSHIGRELASMVPGDVRGPVESQNGWHVIKLQAKEPAPPLSQEIVRDIRKRRALEYLRKTWNDSKRALDLRSVLAIRGA